MRNAKRGLKMYSFEGEFRRRPQQNLSGASKKQERNELLQRAQNERHKREVSCWCFLYCNYTRKKVYIAANESLLFVILYVSQ